MKAVLDTNVIVSAVLIKGGNEDRILRSWQRGLFELVISPQILEEMRGVLAYQRILKARWMTEDEVTLLLESLAQESVIVSGRVTVKISRDSEDDKFLAAAIEAGAHYVVTGDK